MNIFKTYDIRGMYPKEINEKVFYNIGARLKKLGVKKIAVGRDARLSSDSLFKALSLGMIDSGIKVIDLGVVTDPMLSFYSASNKTMGAMITASHNPKEYNGIKFIDERGIQLDYDSFLKKIERMMDDKMLKEKNKGEIEQYDVTREYAIHFLSNFKYKPDKVMKAVFDCSNGVGGIPLTSILPNFDIESFILNEKPEGSFPGHGCDQTKPENLVQLQKEVLMRKADLGIIFDGDADRCAFVDEKGQIVKLDLAFLALALSEIKKKNAKGAEILFDLRFSRAVAEFLKEKGAVVKIMRVGNPFYKEEMHKNKNAIMAGELSGHIMYNENYGIDDGLYASMKMIQLLSQSDKKFSDIIKQYDKYYSSGEIPLKVKDAKKVINSIESRYKDQKESHVDGISVYEKEVWFNIRPSNTEAVIRMEIEGLKKNVVDNQKKEILKLIKGK